MNLIHWINVVITICMSVHMLNISPKILIGSVHMCIRCTCKHGHLKTNKCDDRKNLHEIEPMDGLIQVKTS